MSYVSPNAFRNGNKYATCLLCDGLAEIGFVVNTKLDKNNETRLINSILVLSEEDYKKFLTGDLSDEKILSYFDN